MQSIIRLTLNVDRTRSPNIANDQVNNGVTVHEHTADVTQVLLESLAFKRMDSRLQNIRAAHKRTCMWLFEQPQYKDWRDGTKITEHHGFLWIKGKPGCGKSTIMKIALARSKKERPYEITLSYFFNARAPDLLEKSSLGMYRSLVHQLLTTIPELQKDFTRTFLRKVGGGEVDEWTIVELQNFMLSIMDRIQGQSLSLYIDALDEGEENDVRSMITFLEELGDVSVSNTVSINICLSSRHYPHINIRNGLSLIMESQQGHDQDIVKYVRNQLSGDNGPKHETLMLDICQKASGVFLWVVLVVPMLNILYDQGHESAMRRRLQDIPTELDGLFAEILGRNAETRDKSVLLLQWVLFSFRPLSPIELYLAVESGTVSPDEMEVEQPSQAKANRYILNYSKGLTELSKSQPPTILFIHETIRGFLLHNNGLSILQPELGANLAGISHDQLSRCCIQFLQRGQLDLEEAQRGYFFENQSKRDEGVKNARTQLPFLEYAVNHVFKHANDAQGQGISQGSFLESLKATPEDLERWVWARNRFERYKIREYTSRVTLLYIFSETNQEELVKSILQNPIDWDSTGERYGSALQAACANGHDRIACLLIKAGVDINVSGGEHEHAFAAAVFKKHDTVVQLLHQEGVVIPQHLLTKCLFSAVRTGSTQTIATLLDMGAEINSPNSQGKVPLLRAVEKGFIKPIELLLDRGASLEYCTGRFMQNLDAAIEHGHTQVLQLLLRRKVKLDVDNMLITASKTNHSVIVQLLLDNGAEVNASGGAALCNAIKKGNMETIQLLLSNGANVKASGSAPLRAAAEMGNLQLVEVLLDNGADVNVQCGQALCIAAERDKWEIVQLLVENGADVNVQGGKALRTAAERDKSEIVQLLVENGADVNVQCGQALCIAAERDKWEIVQLLVENGADVNVQDGAALSIAVRMDHKPIVQFLLGRGASVDAWKKLGRSALVEASTNGNIEMIHLLLDNGANVNAQGGYFGNALQAASKQGHLMAVQLLLRRNADPNAQDGINDNALQVASANGHLEVIRELLANGANVNAQGEYWVTALQAASDRASVDVIQLLLDNGADVNYRAGCYGNALRAARCRGREDVVQLLLKHGAKE